MKIKDVSFAACHSQLLDLAPPPDPYPPLFLLQMGRAIAVYNLGLPTCRSYRDLTQIGCLAKNVSVYWLNYILGTVQPENGINLERITMSPCVKFFCGLFLNSVCGSIKKPSVDGPFLHKSWKNQFGKVSLYRWIWLRMSQSVWSWPCDYMSLAVTLEKFPANSTEFVQPPADQNSCASYFTLYIYITAIINICMQSHLKDTIWGTHQDEKYFTNTPTHPYIKIHM